LFRHNIKWYANEVLPSGRLITGFTNFPPW